MRHWFSGSLVVGLIKTLTLLGDGVATALEGTELRCFLTERIYDFWSMMLLDCNYRETRRVTNEISTSGQL